MLAFVSMTHSITTLPAAFRTAMEILSLCNVHADIFSASHKGVPPLERLSEHSTYSTRGALLYCVGWSQWVDANTQLELTLH